MHHQLGGDLQAIKDMKYTAGISIDCFTKPFAFYKDLENSNPK